MLISGHWRMLQNCRVYWSVQFLNTDHRLVGAFPKLWHKSRKMAQSQLRLDVGKFKDERAAEEFANRLRGDLGVSKDPEELWSAFKTTILDVASVCLRIHCQAKRNFVSQKALDTIDQSYRARLNGRTELFRELRHENWMCAEGGQGGLCARNL